MEPPASRLAPALVIGGAWCFVLATECIVGLNTAPPGALKGTAILVLVLAQLLCHRPVSRSYRFALTFVTNLTALACAIPAFLVTGEGGDESFRHLPPEFATQTLSAVLVVGPLASVMVLTTYAFSMTFGPRADAKKDG